MVRVLLMSSRLEPTFIKQFDSGWRVVGGCRIYFRSRWEANYARYLEWLKQRGDITGWAHEPETFWFLKIKRGVRSYLIDFRVVERSGAVVYHEVKGWMDPRSKTKLKRMAKYYPDVRVVVVGRGTMADLAAKLGRVIPGWETKKEAPVGRPQLLRGFTFACQSGRKAPLRVMYPSKSSAGRRGRPRRP